MAGVGWASFAAEASTAAIGVVVVLRLTGGAAWPRLAHILERVAFLRMIAVNRDIMIRSFALLFAFGFFTAQSARGGDVVLAANEILLNFTMLAAFFLDGLAAAAEQFAGRAIGARYRPAFERSLRLVVGWGFAVAAVVSVAVFFLGPLLIDLMTASPEVRETARLYLPYAALVPIAGTLAYQMDGVFIGATWSAEMRNMMLVSLVVYLAVWFVLAPPLGMAGLWIALLVFVGVRGLTLWWICRAKTRTAFPAPVQTASGRTEAGAVGAAERRAAMGKGTCTATAPSSTGPISRSSGSAPRAGVADAIKAMEMSHAWLRVHGKNGAWRTDANMALAEAFRAAGIDVGVWGWNDGNDVDLDIANAVAAIDRYEPYTYIADIENGVDGASWTVPRATRIRRRGQASSRRQAAGRVELRLHRRPRARDHGGDRRHRRFLRAAGLLVPVPRAVDGAGGRSRARRPPHRQPGRLCEASASTTGGRSSPSRW